MVSCTGTTFRLDLPVLLVGYNPTHWFIKNAWGYAWGANVYAYISKDVNQDCGIRQSVIEMALNIDFPVTDIGDLNLTLIPMEMAGTEIFLVSSKTMLLWQPSETHSQTEAAVCPCISQLKEILRLE